MTDQKPTYVEDEAYQQLITDLLEHAATLDPRGRVIELLGMVANVWPASIREDSPSGNRGRLI